MFALLSNIFPFFEEKSVYGNFISLIPKPYFVLFSTFDTGILIFCENYIDRMNMVSSNRRHLLICTHQYFPTTPTV